MRDPTKTTTTAYRSSKLGTQEVHEYVKRFREFSVAEHLSKLKETVSQACHTQNAADMAKLNILISTFSPECQRALRSAETSDISSWLTSTPFERYHLTCNQMNLRMVLHNAICGILLTSCMRWLWNLLHSATWYGLQKGGPSDTEA